MIDSLEVQLVPARLPGGIPTARGLRVVLGRPDFQKIGFDLAVPL
jgi:hypothetical protein